MDSELQLLYQEYVRLHELVNHYTDSSYADFQLLAAIGAMLAWEPISRRLAAFKGVKVDVTEEQAGEQLLFWGFIAILLVLLIIASRDLGKQSIVAFYMSQLGGYEASITAMMGNTSGTVFQLDSSWTLWKSEVHSYPVILFRSIVATTAIIFPAMILYGKGHNYTVKYLMVSGVSAFIYGLVAIRVYCGLSC